MSIVVALSLSLLYQVLHARKHNPAVVAACTETYA